MAKRIRIPYLFDVLLVENLSELTLVDEHPDIERTLRPAAGLLGRWLRRALEEDLRFHGSLLPAFRMRRDETRAQRQGALERTLADYALDLRAGPSELKPLRDYVRGVGSRRAAASAVQKLVGRTFAPTYASSPATYRAARLMESWPRQPWTAPLGRLTGRLRDAKEELAEAADRDQACIHATGIAMHNIVRSLDRLRRRYRRGELGPLTEADYVAPSLVLRTAVHKTHLPFLNAPLAAGTLIIAPLERLHRSDLKREFVFREQGWSRCPAHNFVPRLLESAWGGAVSNL